MTPAMENFSEFIKDLNLIYLSLEGGSYTWSSGTDQPLMSRIDKSMVTSEMVIQRILPRPISYHSPTLLKAWGMARGKSHFSFENMWLKTDGFVDRVQSEWNRHLFVGTPSFTLERGHYSMES